MTNNFEIQELICYFLKMEDLLVSKLQNGELKCGFTQKSMFSQFTHPNKR